MHPAGAGPAATRPRASAAGSRPNGRGPSPACAMPRPRSSRPTSSNPSTRLAARARGDRDGLPRPEARGLLKAAGADVQRRQRARAVRARAGVERIQTAPSSFTLHATNPAHALEIGGDWIAFGSVGERAERRRPRPRPTGRQPRRLPGPHPAVPDARARALLRRLPGRADRPPRVGAPPRCHPRSADAGRQADPLPTRWAGSGTATPSRWSGSPAASTTRRSSASPRSSRSSTRRRRCDSTRRCSRASSRCRRATRSWS